MNDRLEPPPEREQGPPLQVKTEREGAWILGKPQSMLTVVRVRYRPNARGRWRTFLLVPDKGQPLEQLEELAEHAAYHHFAGKR